MMAERVDFLWRASHQYSTTCPQLAAYWSDRLLDVAGAAPPAVLAERLCPGCSSLLLPSLPTSPAPRLRTVSLRKLKSIRRQSGGRKGVWLMAPLGRARAYVLVSCVCGGSYVAAALRGKSHTADTPAGITKKPSSKKRRKSGHSATLKTMLEESSQRETQRQKAAASPSLSLFLTALNT